MRCKPCKVTYQGTRYVIASDGTVAVSSTGYCCSLVEDELATRVRAEAQRQRHNRNHRERHQAMTDLGLKRVRGSLGGVYYE